jgi:hypothetical protein
VLAIGLIDFRNQPPLILPRLPLGLPEIFPVSERGASIGKPMTPRDYLGIEKGSLHQSDSWTPGLIAQRNFSFEYGGTDRSSVIKKGTRMSLQAFKFALRWNVGKGLFYDRYIDVISHMEDFVGNAPKKNPPHSGQPPTS